MSQVTLFTDILPEEQERMRVCFQAREVSFHNHEIIFAYSNTMNKIGLILSGRAVLYYCDEEGNQYMIDELKRTRLFGEPFLLPADSRNYYVQAEEETRVMFIDYAQVIKRCENACWHHSQLVSQPAPDDCPAVPAAGAADLRPLQNHYPKEASGLSGKSR